MQPSAASRGSAQVGNDVWADAIRYYGAPVLRALQKGGAMTVQDLLVHAKSTLPAPDLAFDQFDGVICRMVEGGMIEVVRDGATPPERQVALPIKRK